MRLITVQLPKHYIDLLDKLVKDKLYANRSEAIRAAVRDLLELHGYWGAKREDKGFSIKPS